MNCALSTPGTRGTEQEIGPLGDETPDRIRVGALDADRQTDLAERRLEHRAFASLAARADELAIRSDQNDAVVASSIIGDDQSRHQVNFELTRQSSQPFEVGSGGEVLAEGAGVCRRERQQRVAVQKRLRRADQSRAIRRGFAARIATYSM